MPKSDLSSGRLYPKTTAFLCTSKRRPNGIAYWIQFGLTRKNGNGLASKCTVQSHRGFSVSALNRRIGHQHQSTSPGLRVSICAVKTYGFVLICDVACPQLFSLDSQLCAELLSIPRRRCATSPQYRRLAEQGQSDIPLWHNLPSEHSI